MKLKFLCVLLLIIGLSAFASSDEYANCAAKIINCNKNKVKNVTGDDTLISRRDVFEFSPASMLLFEI
jgi:hypothetical protein